MEFEVGNGVLLPTQNFAMEKIHAKMINRFCGPFTMTQRVGQEAYRLDMLTNWLIHNVFLYELIEFLDATSYIEIAREWSIKLEET